MKLTLNRIFEFLEISLLVSVFVGRTFAQEPTDRNLSNAPSVAPQEKAAVKRIGLIMPASDLGSGPTAGESIREVEALFLKGPKVEVLKLNALLPDQAYAEARQSHCDYVLTTSVKQKKAGGGLGALRTLSAAAPLASMVPGAGPAAAMAGMAASQSVYIASTAVASGIKAKSEVSLAYQLTSSDGQVLLADTQKAKSKSDGDDVLTPMLQKAATNLMAVLDK